MAFLDDYAVASDEDFQKRVNIAVVKAAANVAGEAQGGMGDDKFRKRAALAYQTLNTPPSQYVFRWALAVVREGLINLASTDGDIEFTVNSLWDDFAGVLSTE